MHFVIYDIFRAVARGKPLYTCIFIEEVLLSVARLDLLLQHANLQTLDGLRFTILLFSVEDFQASVPSRGLWSHLHLRACLDALRLSIKVTERSL